MDGVTDAAFRRVVAGLGRPDVIFTEFTHVHDVCRGPEFLLSSLVYSERERPIVAQLYGKDPDLFYVAAQAVCELGFDGLDINMGCPSRNVAASGSGAGLIRTPDLAHAIMRAARQGIEDWAAGHSLESIGFKPTRAALLRRMNLQRQGISQIGRRVIPLSVKTRLGYDSVVIDAWLQHLLRERPTAVTLHGRTLQQMYRGEADWTAIARAVELVEGTDTILLGNGDLQSPADVVKRIQDSRVHGVLVGRGTLGRPWFFRDKEWIRTRVSEVVHPEMPMADESWGVDLAERFRIMVDHACQFERLFEPNQFRRIRKHLGWYCRGFPHAAAMRARMFHVSSVSDVKAILDEFQERGSPDLEAVVLPMSKTVMSPHATSA